MRGDLISYVRGRGWRWVREEKAPNDDNKEKGAEKEAEAQTET